MDFCVHSSHHIFCQMQPIEMNSRTGWGGVIVTILACTATFSVQLLLNKVDFKDIMRVDVVKMFNYEVFQYKVAAC